MVLKVKKTSLESFNNDKDSNNWEVTDEPLRSNETIYSRGYKSEKSERKNLLKKIPRPSTRGSTACISNSKRKFGVKFYRRKLKHFKTLIKILISIKSENTLKNIIQQSLGYLEDNHKDNLGISRSVEADGAEGHQVPRCHVITENSKPKHPDVRKLEESIKSAKKMPLAEKKTVPSTSRQFYDIADELPDRVISVERKCGDYQNAKSQTTCNSSGKNRGRNGPEEIWLDESYDTSYEFSDDDIIVESSCPGPSKKKSQIMNKGIGWRTTVSKNFQKSNFNMRNAADQSKGGRLTSEIDLQKVTVTSKKNEKAAVKPPELKKPQPDETDRFNSAEINVKKSNPPAGGIQCLCKSKKLKGCKVPLDVECPSLKCDGKGNGISDQDVLKKDEVSPICEKKSKNFYSPLELKYSAVLRSKLDGPKEVAKKNEDGYSKPLAGEFSNPAIYNKNSLNNSEGSAECSKPVQPKSSDSLKYATFSKYSIPVSIEINMVPDKMRLANLNRNLIQSKITNYCTVVKAQDRLQWKNVVKQDSNLNIVGGSNNFDENGNKMERKNIVAREKTKSRSLPVVQSDVLLKNRGDIVFLDNYPALQRPKLSISRQEYLYNVLKYPIVDQVSTSNPSGNQNIIFYENITLSNTNNNCNVVAKENSDHCGNFNIIDDSNGSGGSSIIPPSYSVFSDDNKDGASVLEVDISDMIILDSQQREDLLAPWDKVDNLEKVNRWNVGSKF